jgi:hypothetical protein
LAKALDVRVGYPAVLHAWHAHQGELAEALLLLICECYGEFPNTVQAARERWDADFRAVLNYPNYPLQTTISALAIVSPSTSKGSYSAAGAWKLLEDTPEQFWLEITTRRIYGRRNAPSAQM